MADEQPLLFSGSSSYLSNFSNYPISLRNKLWPTTEHYFQGQKFAGTEVEELIRAATSPADAKQMGGKGGKHKLRNNWENIKEQIMYEALLAKFTQHPELRAKLLDTGNQELIEDNPKDLYWGNNASGAGKNRLGVLLMEVRAFLRRLSPEEVPVIRVFEENDPTTQITFITAAAQLSVRRQKCKARKNVWKDQAGVSLFEIDNDGSGNAEIVGGGGNFKIPLGALPSKAKIVAKQYQFEKRFEAHDSDFSDSEDDEEFSRPQNRNNTLQIGDFIPSEITRTPKRCIDEVFEKLSILTALPENDESRRLVLNNCQDLQKEIVDFIQQGQTEEIMVELLLQLDSLNSVLVH